MVVTSPVRKVIAKHLFDFFMLFLAVSLGFFVDNYRDSYNERKTAKEIAADLVADISLDTADINDLLHHCVIKMNMLDSLYQQVGDQRTSFDDSLIYYYASWVDTRPWFERHDAVFTLLTHTGNLSYFTKDAASAITSYNIVCGKTINMLEMERSVLSTKISPFQQQIFHTENFRSLLTNGKMMEKPALQNWHQQNRWLYHNYITELRILNASISEQYKQLLAKAAYTMSILKQEYLSP